MDPLGGFSHMYETISRDVNKKYRHLRQNITARLATDDGTATFEDFANYLIDLGGPEEMDMHWRQFESLCDPCNYEYDMILKFDTLDEDLTYLKEYLNISAYHLPAFFPTGKTKTNNELTSMFMKSLHISLRVKLYELYKRDFELFGYDKPLYV